MSRRTVFTRGATIVSVGEFSVVLLGPNMPLAAADAKAEYRFKCSQFDDSMGERQVTCITRP
jgi:hypothetical protein